MLYKTKFCKGLKYFFNSNSGYFQIMSGFPVLSPSCFFLFSGVILTQTL